MMNRKPLMTLRALSGAATLAALPVLLAGCGGGGSGGGSTGTLRVAMVDAPDPTITALNVTIDRIEAHVVNPDDPNDNEPSHWRAITAAPQTLDLLDLVDNAVTLGTAPVPAGHYTQVRLFISSATVTDATGTHNVTVPSAGNTGIKVNVDHTIAPNQLVALLLDFNVSKSLIKTGAGAYKLQPVIPAVVQILSGTISGTVTHGGAPLDSGDVKAVYTAGDKYPIGTVVNNTFSQDDGSFKIWALLPGTYDVVVTAPDTHTATKSGVVVVADQNTNAGTIVVP